MRNKQYQVEREPLINGTSPVSRLLMSHLKRSAECSEREGKLSSTTQEDKQQERRRKQAKRVCHSQGGERSQTSQLGRDGASQLVGTEVTVDFHKAQGKSCHDQHKKTKNKNDDANKRSVFVTHSSVSAVKRANSVAMVPVSWLNWRFLLMFTKHRDIC